MNLACKSIALIILAIFGVSGCSPNNNSVNSNLAKLENQNSNLQNKTPNSVQSPPVATEKIERDALPAFKNPKSYEWKSHNVTLVYPDDRWEISAEKSKIESEVIGNTKTKQVPFVELKLKTLGTDKIFLQISDFTPLYTADTPCSQSLPEIARLSLLGATSKVKSKELAIGNMPGDIISDIKYGTFSSPPDFGTAWFGCRPTGKKQIFRIMALADEDIYAEYRESIEQIIKATKFDEQ